MGLQVFEMVAPVILMIGLGFLCRKRGYMNDQGLAGLKGVVGNITLPVVLFQAFFTADYSMRMLVVFLVVYASFGIALAVGFALRKWVSPYGKFMPFLLTSAEGGMLGYALYALIAGEENTSVFAMVDIGQTLFAYTVFMTGLKIIDGKKADAAGVLKEVVSNKACLGMLFGIVLGITGVGQWVLNSPVSGVVTSLIDFVTAPTAGMILIVVGCELSFEKTLVVPVIKTVLLRLAVLGVLLVMGSMVIFTIIPFDKQLFMALLLMYALPAPFIIPLFAEVGEDGAYISNTLSVGTLAAVAAFSGIIVYSMM